MALQHLRVASVPLQMPSAKAPARLLCSFAGISVLCTKPEVKLAIEFSTTHREDQGVGRDRVTDTFGLWLGPEGGLEVGMLQREMPCQHALQYCPSFKFC